MFSRVPITPNPDYFTESTHTNAPTSLDSLSTATASSSVSDSMASPLTDDLASASSDWWSNAIEEDSFYSPLPFDASESGLWNGRFVPPPPRPPFWDDTITSDGLTTCDLCTWALHERNAFSYDGSISGEFFLFSNASDECYAINFQMEDQKRRARNLLEIIGAMPMPCEGDEVNYYRFLFSRSVPSD